MQSLGGGIRTDENEAVVSLTDSGCQVCARPWVQSPALKNRSEKQNNWGELHTYVKLLEIHLRVESGDPSQEQPELPCQRRGPAGGSLEGKLRLGILVNGDMGGPAVLT